MDDKRFNALIKLCLWLVFIALLVIIVKFSGKSSKNDLVPKKENNNLELRYKEQLNNLKDNYHYQYEIKNGDQVYYFTGDYLNNLEVGHRNFNNQDLQYYQENGSLYEVIDGSLHKIDNLYDDIDTSWLDVNNLKNILQNNHYKEENNNYIYLLNNQKIIGTLEEENLQVEIILDNAYFKLIFSDIGKITEIKY